ncbi:hypothetical protein LMH73_026760 [Vibrio splendidus]|nr:hypothetical protein [Vibrio splendidus]MCC4883075.1 hypothetical protein [Vibrio splendidus]
MKNELSENDVKVIEATNKLNKYVCAYPTRGVNISNALNSAGCKKMNTVFELAVKATTEKDMVKLRAAVKSLVVYINQYGTRVFAVAEALKPTGSILLTNLEVLVSIEE